MRVIVTMKDGKERKFPSRPNLYEGDYLRVTYEGAFVVISEKMAGTWSSSRIAIPAADVVEVKEYR